MSFFHFASNILVVLNAMDSTKHLSTFSNSMRGSYTQHCDENYHPVPAWWSWQILQNYRSPRLETWQINQKLIKTACKYLRNNSRCLLTTSINKPLVASKSWLKTHMLQNTYTSYQMCVKRPCTLGFGYFTWWKVVSLELDGHPTFNIFSYPYVYLMAINPYYWVDDHPLGV